MYGSYDAVDSDKVKMFSDPEAKIAEEKAKQAKLPEKEVEKAIAEARAAEPRTAAVGKVTEHAQHSALGTMAIFPCAMLACYLLMLAYFKTKGGYKPVELKTGS
jgi:hypothetical protein